MTPSFSEVRVYYTRVAIHHISVDGFNPPAPSCGPTGMRFHHTGKAWSCAQYMVFQWFGQLPESKGVVSHDASG